MNKQKQTLRLIIEGRYSRTKIDNQNQQANMVDVQLSSIQRQKELEQEQIKKIIKQKYKTFARWDFRQSLPKHLRRLSQTQSNKTAVLNQNNSTTLLNFSKVVIPDKKAKNKNDNKGQIQNNQLTKKIVKAQSVEQGEKMPKIEGIAKRQDKKTYQNNTAEMIAIKQDRRQRFKKIQNPMQFLKHYMQKQKYCPTSQQKALIERMLSIQKSIQAENCSHNDEKQPNLQHILDRIYKLMNLAVDYNELLFLALVICLAADICYFMKDYTRSFYFYNQARIAGSYAHLDQLKTNALMGIGQICFDLQLLQQSKRLFRKALQYAWRNSDENTQLEVYDWYGKIYNQRGKVRQSMFYHQKYAKNLAQPFNSPLKRISNQMLRDYDKHIQSLESSNLDSLFLQYIHLPINKSFEIKNKANEGKVYKNYENGKSPRMNKEFHDFSRKSFPDIEAQLSNLLVQDYQFKTEIPDPDKPGSRQLNRMFNRSGYQQSFDGKKRQIQFEHSIEYNRIVRKKHEKPDIKKQLKKPLDEQVQQMLKQKLRDDWYQSMVYQIKKRRMEKVGTLKQKIRNSHLSYGKYPTERKRHAVWSTQKINQCFNKTLLDWIDPVN